MKIEKFIESHVKEDGTFDDKPGAICTGGSIRMSTGEGCGVPGCHCSDGFWISIILPKTEEGVVEDIKATFDTKKELTEFLRTTHQIDLKIESDEPLTVDIDSGNVYNESGKRMGAG